MNAQLDQQNEIHAQAKVSSDEGAHYIPTAAERAEAAMPAPPIARPVYRAPRRSVIRGEWDKNGHYHDID